MAIHRLDRLAPFTVNARNPTNPAESIIKLRGIYYHATLETRNGVDYLNLETISPCTHELYIRQWGKP